MLGLTKPSPMSSTPPPAGSTGTTTAGSTAPSEWSRPPNTSKPTTLPSTRRSSPHENGTKAVTLQSLAIKPARSSPCTLALLLIVVSPGQRNRSGCVWTRIKHELQQDGCARTSTPSATFLLRGPYWTVRPCLSHLQAPRDRHHWQRARLRCHAASAQAPSV